MSLSRTISEINGNLNRKSQVFSIPPVYLTPPEAVPLWIWYRCKESKN